MASNPFIRIAVSLNEQQHVELIALMSVLQTKQSKRLTVAKTVQIALSELAAKYKPIS